MEWMLLPLKRYADFSGRSRRKEYWMFVLGQLIVFAVLVALFLLMSPAHTVSPDGVPTGGGASMLIVVLGVLFVLAIFIPTLALQVRRFHDQDKSGWFVLLQFIPTVGGIIMIVFMCMEGTKGENRFGSDPVAENLSETFA